ncbi:Os11g0706700, partial [Oryza sativa Japonica Group]
AEGDEVALGVTTVEAGGVVVGVAVRTRADGLEKVGEDGGAARRRRGVVPRAAVAVAAHGPAGAPATRHPPFPVPHLQRRRAAHVHVRPARRRPAPHASPHRRHRHRRVEPVHQAHVVEVHRRRRRPQRHLHHRRGSRPRRAVAPQHAAAVARRAAAAPAGVEAAAPPRPHAPRPPRRHLQRRLLAGAQVEAARLRRRVPRGAQQPRPHRLAAVVHH